MWKCVFSAATNRGVGCNRAATEGEYTVDIPAAHCAWFNAFPERYQFVDGVFSEYPGWENEQSEIAAATAALKARINAIEQARETAGVHKLTVAQAQNYINNRINNAATAAEKVEAVRDILLKMVPYLLN